MAEYLTEAHRINSEKVLKALERQGRIKAEEAVKKMQRMHTELREREGQLGKEKNSECRTES